MITVPIFTRIMSTSEIGMVNLYNSWYSLLSVIATLSLTSGGFQAAMKDFEGERDQYQSAVLTLTSMMAIVLGCIYFLIPDIWNRIIGLPSVLIILIRIIFRHSRDGYLLESMRMRASAAHLWNTEKGCSS